MDAISKLEIENVLKDLPLWAKMDGREAIVREFKFKDFGDAFAFMTRCAIKAQIMDHHPEWFNCYDTVVVLLTTHDVNGLSERDIEMAQFMDQISGEIETVN